jgi:Dyp-type peroxidase family
MIDFSDIQGNILRGYRSFPFTRFLFFVFGPKEKAQNFIQYLLDHNLITPGEWKVKPKETTNIALAFKGLRTLGLQAESLASFPPEFQQGMLKRALLLGDSGPSSPHHWDDPWVTARMDMLVTCYANSATHLDQHCKGLETIASDFGIDSLRPCQDAGLLLVNGRRTRLEHFGFTDGISNPDVEGVPDNGRSGDIGNPDDKGVFRKIPVGEFLLGHRSEGGEVSPMPAPNILARNGTYLVVRKLEQDVVAFRKFLAATIPTLRAFLPQTLPTLGFTEEFLAAKLLGRWRDGSPLDLYPDRPGGRASNDFGYENDPEGTRCPLGAHTRRVNGRASLGFGGALVKRRRLIRRGITYGEYLPDDKPADEGDRSGRGLMFLAFNARISHQFEFVQRQWISYGDEFHQGDDSDPITGSRLADGRMVAAVPPFTRERPAQGRMVIPGDQRTGRLPFLITNIPSFVTTKGGGYYFVPSFTALRLIASGKVVVS